MTVKILKNAWKMVQKGVNCQGGGSFFCVEKKIGNNFDKTNTVQNGATGITEACIPFLPTLSNFPKTLLALWSMN